MMLVSPPTALLSQEQRESLARDGYLHLSGFFSNTWLDEVEALITSNLKEGRLEMPPARSDELYAVQALSERVPELRRHFWSGPVVELAKQLLGPSIRLVSNRYLVKPPRSKELFPWHRDNEEYAHVKADEGLTFWFPMVSVSRENGCLWYVAGSHLAPEGGRPAPAPVCVPMQRGDLAVHSLGTKHMSGSNRSSEPRAVVALEYIRADAVHPETGQPFEHAVLIVT
jgi:ectoine hydroxylase-related dioxygenase (phytanoyl-CoA dioxygenase family)